MKRSSQKAFSFLEVIISLFVLSVGFLGVINLAATTLRYSFLQRDATIASMLVQEGAELVYTIRDTNAAKGDPVFTGISEGSYRVSPLGSSISLEGNSDSVLRRDNNGFYIHGNGGTATKFSRRVFVSGSGSTRTITVVVTWGSGTPPSNPSESNCSLSTIPRCSFARTELQDTN